MGINDARSLEQLSAEVSRNGSRHTHSVQSLFNAAKSPPADGDVWAFDSASKLWTPTALTIDALSDVTITSVADADTLEYDTGSSTWVNTAKNYTVTTSGARPASSEGRAIYETDTDGLQVYNGVGWNPPWNLPWGRVATTSSTATGAPGSDILTVTFTAVANRRYRIEGAFHSTVATAPSNCQGILLGGAGPTTLNVENIGTLAVGYFFDPFLWAYDTPAAGSITYRLRSGVAGGSLTLAGSSSQPHTLTVDDVGPNGVPA